MLARSALVLATALLTIVGAGSSLPAAGQLPPGLPKVTGLPKVPRGTVSYLFHAQFDLDYEYDWVQTSGDRSAPCSYWTDTRGSNAMSAGSLRWIPGQLTLAALTRQGLLPERTSTVTATGSRRVGGRIVANARAEIIRRLVHRGGTTAGCTVPPSPFKVPLTDCGSRAYETKAATLLLQGAKGSKDTLETLLQHGTKAAIRISVPPPAEQYRKCEMGAFPPAYPVYLPVGLRSEHIAKLRNLDEGEVATINFDRGGLCKADRDPSSSCHFGLHITLKIRRWVPGTPFP